MLDPTPENLAETDADRPPILGNWTNVYLVVLALHALIIALFYVFTRLHS